MVVLTAEDRVIWNRVPLAVEAAYRCADESDCNRLRLRSFACDSIVEGICTELATEQVRARQAVL